MKKGSESYQHQPKTRLQN